MALEVFRSLGLASKKYLPGISQEERSFRVENVFNAYPLSNSDILFLLIGTIKGLTRSQLTNLADTYKTYASIFPGDNTPVADIVRATGVADLSGSIFFNKVCFNYDRALGGRTRLETALRQLEQGTLKPDFQGHKSVSFNNPDYLTVEQWMEFDIYNLAHALRCIETISSFNPVTQYREERYAMKKHGVGKTRLFGPFLDQYEKNIFPLLDNDEIVKPSSPKQSTFAREKPEIIRMFFNKKILT